MEVIHTQEAEEDGVEEGGHKIVIGVLDAREPGAQEHTGTRALYAVQRPATSFWNF